MVTSTVTEIRRNGSLVGKPVKLARRATPADGEPICYGQRPAGSRPSVASTSYATVSPEQGRA